MAMAEVKNKLPKARFWDAMDIAHWQGFWFEPGLIGPAATFQSTFAVRPDDVLLASTMKTGTTWLKSLALCIMGRADLLPTDSPHFHVPTIESTIYSTKPLAQHDAASRLLHTHLPYSVLPASIRDPSSPCRIVYIARNPKDTLVSTWHFFNTILQPFPLEKAVECFCSGVHLYGPFFDHVAEYWTESQRRPEKILFLRYEEMKGDPVGHVLRIAEFVGRPMSAAAAAEEVVRKCSLDTLKNLEVNKNGSVLMNVPNWSYFRKGEVGDWNNYLTPEMEKMIDQISRTKLEPLGLFL